MLDANNDAAVAADLQLLTSRAAAGDLDLTGHGLVQGELTGLLYELLSSQFVADHAAVGPFATAQLLALANAGDAELAFTAVPPGSGERIARDRDLDGVVKGDEAASAYGQATAGCAGESTLMANSEARVGNGLFGCTIENAPPDFLALAVLSLGPASLPGLGVQILVDPATAVPALIASDPFGDAGFAFPIPPSPANASITIYAQALWLDPCGIELWSSSAGLQFTIGN